MFTLNSINNAGIHNSKNPILRKLYAEIMEYNGLPQVGSTGPGAIRLLDKIMKHAAVYLTSKRPGVKVKNALRWDAMADLANQAAHQARNREVKLLTSPADFRNIQGDPRLGNQSYWLERVDPYHRPGYVLSGLYEAWVKKPRSIAHPDRSFWDSIKAPADTDPQVTMVKGADDDGHNYSDAYQLRQDGDAFIDSLDEPFDTQELSTAHSGDGWAVFVCSPEGKLYARSHEIGFFHHSSFLAGKPVAAAGEIVADGGVIKLITAKTGHYKAGMDEMRRLLRLVPGIPGDALILPDFVKMEPPPRGEKKAFWYRCDQFRVSGAAAPFQTKAQVRAQAPWFAKKDLTKGMFARVPETNP